MPDYYVYELIDYSNPNEPKVFYVGKGVGSRVYEHAKKVLNKIQSGDEIVDPKERALQQLLETKSPECLKEIVIGRYETEAEALAVESTLIKWVYGHNNLTNIVHGHQAKHIRPKGNYEFENELQPRTYMGEIRHAIESGDVIQRAERLATSLEQMGFLNIKKGWQGQDYGLFWQVPGFPVIVQLKMQANNNKVVMNARPSLQTLKALKLENPNKDTKDQNLKEFKTLLINSGYIISAAESFDLAFAALFESNVKSGGKWTKDQQDTITEITEQSIKLRTSFHYGIESSNFEVIGGYLRDLEIRLKTAKMMVTFEAEDTIIKKSLISLIKLFQSKPATKYFTKGNAG